MKLLVATAPAESTLQTVAASAAAAVIVAVAVTALIPLFLVAFVCNLPKALNERP